MQLMKGKSNMTRDDIKVAVIELLEELFAEANFDANILEYIDLIDDAGMDSISFISLIVEIESKFDIIVPDDKLLMDNFKNVDDIIVVVENELTKGVEN